MIGAHHTYTGYGMRRILLVVLLVAAGIAWAGPGVWTSGGPYGGIVNKLVFDPVAPTTIYASANGSFFKTINRGASWNRAQAGIAGFVGDLFVVDSDAPTTLYLFDSTNRLYRSLDGAANWALTGYTAPANFQVTGLAEVPGSSGELLIALAVFTDANGVPLPIAGSRLLRSIDGGNTFAPRDSGLPANLDLASVAVDPTNPNRVLAGARETSLSPPVPIAVASVYRSINAGASWTPVFTDPGATSYVPDVSSISFGAGSTVYTNLNFGQILRSDDDGASFLLRSGFTGFRQIAAHPSVAMEVWVGDQRSIDGGDNFLTAADGLTANPTYLDNLGVPVPAEVVGLAFEPGYPAPGTSLWAATAGAGVMRRPVSASSWNATGINGNLGATNIRSLAINPNPSAIGGGRAQNLFAGFSDGQAGSTAGLFRSDDGATSWSVANDGLEASALRTVIIDPLSVGTTGLDIANSIVYAGGRSAFSRPGARNGGLYRSRNNGVTWQRIEGNLPTRLVAGLNVVDVGTVRGMVLDPRSCTLPVVPTGPVCSSGSLHRLYATSSGSRHSPARPFRVMVSDNADTLALNGAGRLALNWVALDTTLPATINDGLRSQEVTPVNIVIDPNDSSRLFIGTFTSYNDFDPNDATPLDDLPSGVFRSVDAGATWAQASTGLPRLSGFTNTAFSVLSLAIHPTDGNILWASVVDNDINPSSGSVYKTTDGGNSWFESATGIASRIDIRKLLVDPIAPNILYAAGAGTTANPGAVYRSDDGGASWRSISIGLPVGSATELALDSFNPTILHAGTSAGVWSLEQLPDADGDGIPDSVEGGINGGDGNADGNPDALQGDVGSSGVSFAAAGAIEAPASVFEVGNFTIDVDVAASSGGNCNQNVDVQGKVAARNGRDFIHGSTRFRSYPQELMRFDVQNCNDAFIDVIYHASVLDFSRYGWSYRFYGPSTPGDDATVGWYDFSSRAVRVGPKRWRLHLTAGELGSYRPAASNTLLFEGGPACYDDRLLQAGFEDNQQLTPPSCAN